MATPEQKKSYLFYQQTGPDNENVAEAEYARLNYVNELQRQIVVLSTKVKRTEFDLRSKERNIEWLEAENRELKQLLEQKIIPSIPSIPSMQIPVRGFSQQQVYSYTGAPTPAHSLSAFQSSPTNLAAYTRLFEPFPQFQHR